MIAGTSWTWDYVEEQLDIPRLVALNRHWRKHPPTHLLMQAFVGHKPREEKVNDPGELAKLFQALRPR